MEGNSDISHEKVAVELFKEHFNHLVLYVNSFVDSIPVAEDIVQDMFVKLWEKKCLAQCKPSFLYVCARNASLNYLRTQNLHAFEVEQIEKVEMPEETERQEAYMEKLERIYEAVESLPPQCREVLKKIYFEGKTYAETAEEMHLSVNTVKTHIYLAIKNLRQNFIYIFFIL